MLLLSTRGRISAWTNARRVEAHVQVQPTRDASVRGRGRRVAFKLCVPAQNRRRSGEAAEGGVIDDIEVGEKVVEVLETRWRRSGGCRKRAKGSKVGSRACCCHGSEIMYDGICGGEAYPAVTSMSWLRLIIAFFFWHSGVNGYDNLQ